MQRLEGKNFLESKDFFQALLLLFGHDSVGRQQKVSLRLVDPYTLRLDAASSCSGNL